MNCFPAIERLLNDVEKPARYVGSEYNMKVKDVDSVKIRFCMTFPDIYEVGMSHLGSRILYGLINERDDSYCERCFAPWVDMEEAMRTNGVPLFSLETHSPLNEFDIIGITLQYEMSYTNILNMLELAGIPLLSSERTGKMPLIVCGGPCAVNPEPLADFVDAFLIGDGEESINELLDLYAQYKDASREDFLKAAANIEGCYVPRFYEPKYSDDGCFSHMEIAQGAPEKISRRIVADLENAYFPTDIIVPYLAIVHDRMMLELFRGCTRGCRFCQAGFLYRPVRERSVDKLLEIARELVKNTGYEEISLTSLSSGDYSCLSELIEKLMSEMSKKRVSVSLPSLRIDSFMKETAQSIQSVRKSGLTFAPEAGTQRLRDVVNKGVTEEDLLRSVGDAFACGWSSVKLYFMLGLPTETDEDLDGIADLAQKVRQAYFAVPPDVRKKGLRIAVSVSTFVPKPCTPFQWEPQIDIEEIERRQQYLKRKLRAVKGVEYSYHTPKLSFLEAAFAKGDRRLGKVLLAAHEKGCKFDSWNDHFSYEKWIEAFDECSIDPKYYANRRRERGEALPYAHIDMRVKEEYLYLEYERALSQDVSKDCRKTCNGCFDPESLKNYCSQAMGGV